MTKKTVVVGMSGGVDSSVAAALLKEQGYSVIGLYMNNWEDPESDICPGAFDWEDVVSVCGKLQIPHYSIKFNKQYMSQVFSYFLDELKNGNTPNPDVLCNRKIKFGVFKEHAKKIGADYIATGHYCGTDSQIVTPFVDNQGIALTRAVDTNKDQSYFLNQVTTEQLDGVLFPLNNIDKSTVREIAKKYALSTSDKKDSTGICFIGERNFKNFLSKYLPAQKGKIIELHTHREVGEHTGLMNYTIGQRRGLGIGGIKEDYAQSANQCQLSSLAKERTCPNNNPSPKNELSNPIITHSPPSTTQHNRWFVVKKDLDKNILWVSRQEQDDLASDGCQIEKLNIIGGTLNTNQFDCTIKLRYRQQDVPATVQIKGDRYFVTFHTPQRAVTVGQFLVMYFGQRCVGGARIISNAKNS